MSQVRLRVSALCIKDGQVLLVEHKSFAPDDPKLPSSYWILPGGVVERGETLEAAVQREMMEETGLECRVGNLLFIKELLYPHPGVSAQGTLHHSVSLGFFCEVTGGRMITGKDPEYPDDKQVIITVSWIPLHDLDHYDLYPPFLADYIRTQPEEGFEKGVPEFFRSPE
ncbi:NUDIX domain-containing protein [Chlorobium sp. BLA1]|uniref:NUDIX domain-containing protein n=1 Tax=Candidatus Chlorobium masyuteum TaxID=2716876 RepID=UPI001420E096|nr:NUDIX domain-containing protein [Candidatus Chlorobium masyuteum]NHQ60181.1 NUDIX domain-containing protein [Candidatus Chlorobium masyuteum]NTU44556.1 NUDIX domain-containing protein [Chlorobiaceae bacterium]